MFGTFTQTVAMFSCSPVWMPGPPLMLTARELGGGRALPSEVSRSQGCLRTHIGMLRMLFPGNPSHCDTNLHWARWDGQQGPRVSKGRGPRDLEKAAFFASGHMEQHFLGPEETPGAVLNRASLWPPLPGGNEMLFGGEQAPLSPPQL